jgi:hypothetical protein
MHAFDTRLAADGSALDVYLTGATDGTVVPLAATG